ncbi:hypothetical protein D3C71_1977430 [compost metagenome]
MSPVSSPALKAARRPSWPWKTRAGASTTRCSGLTAETLMTERPRLPDSSLRPPVVWNGVLVEVSTLGKADSLGAGSKVSLSSMSLASTL